MRVEGGVCCTGGGTCKSSYVGSDCKVACCTGLVDGGAWYTGVDCTLAGCKVVAFVPTKGGVKIVVPSL